jgi:hypothetical protein
MISDGDVAVRWGTGGAEIRLKGRCVDGGGEMHLHEETDTPGRAGWVEPSGGRRTIAPGTWVAVTIAPCCPARERAASSRSLPGPSTGLDGGRMGGRCAVLGGRAFRVFQCLNELFRLRGKVNAKP